MPARRKNRTAGHVYAVDVVKFAIGVDDAEGWIGGHPCRADNVRHIDQDTFFRAGFRNPAIKRRRWQAGFQKLLF